MSQLRGGAYDVTDEGMIIIMVNFSISHFAVVGIGHFWRSGIRGTASFWIMLQNERVKNRCCCESTDIYCFIVDINAKICKVMFGESLVCLRWITNKWTSSVLEVSVWSWVETASECLLCTWFLQTKRISYWHITTL